MVYRWTNESLVVSLPQQAMHFILITSPLPNMYSCIISLHITVRLFVSTSESAERGCFAKHSSCTSHSWEKKENFFLWKQRDYVASLTWTIVSSQVLFLCHMSHVSTWSYKPGECGHDYSFSITLRRNSTWVFSWIRLNFGNITVTNLIKHRLAAFNVSLTVEQM